MLPIVYKQFILYTAIVIAAATSMTRQDIKKALSKSINAEGDAVRDRFSRAENFFASKEESSTKSERKQQAIPVEKQIRDSFTFPPEDYELIQSTIDRCLHQGAHVTKSETLRAALRTLAAVPDEKLLKIFRALPKIKTGRPRKS